MIRMLVDRCHVSDTNRMVIRYLISKLKNGYRTWAAMTRDQRRLVMTEAIRIHTENRALYASLKPGRWF